MQELSPQSVADKRNDYFLIKQHPEYVDAPHLRDFHVKLDFTHFYRDKSYDMPQRTVLNVHPNEHVDFTDYLFQSVPFFSRRAMQLIWQFDRDFIHKQAILFSPKDQADNLYYIPFFPRFPAETVKLIQSKPASGIASYLEAGITLQVPYILPVFFVFDKEKCLVLMRLDSS
jgi:hypothetical protein